MIKLTQDKDWIAKTLYKNGVLKNKLGIHDEKELADLEYRLSAKASYQIISRHLKIKDISDLNKIHKIMFGRLYDWAGKDRPGDFSKGNTVFFPHDRFQFAKKNINGLLADYAKKDKLSKNDYAKLLDELNYYHPFREGNGRSTKTFIQALAAQHNQVIEYPRENSKMIEAEKNADIDGIARLIKLEPTPTEEIILKKLNENK